MPTNIYQRGLRFFVEADIHGGSNGDAVSLVNDLSVYNRDLVAASAQPTVKTGAVNGKRSFNWDGTKNPLKFTGNFKIRCGFLVVKVNGNFTGGYQGILSTPVNYSILNGIGGSGILYDNLYEYFEYRLNDRIYPVTFDRNGNRSFYAPAPISYWGIIYFKFWQGLAIDGIQLGQDRGFTDRKFNGEIAMLALYDRDFCEEEVRKNTQSIANSYQIALPDVFPFQGQKGDAVTTAKRVLSDGQDEPITRIKRGARNSFELNFLDRHQKERMTANAFWNDCHPNKRFYYRDYQNLPPVDTLVRIPENSEFQWKGGNTINNNSYSFPVIESVVPPATSVPIAPVIPLEPDTVPPSITIYAPANFAGVSGTITIDVTVSDDDTGVWKVDFFEGIGNYLGTTVAPPYSFDLDTTAFSDGAHNITAIAFDYAGNQSNLATITIEVNNSPDDTTAPTPPGAPSLSVISATQINGSFAGATDNVAVTHYRLRRATNSAFTTGGVDTDLGTSTSFNATGLAAGTQYWFKVLAEDAAGNQSAYSTSSNATTTVPDMTAPTTPTGFSILGETTNSVTVEWNASTDNVAVTKYQVQYALNSSFTSGVGTQDFDPQVGPSQVNEVTGLTPSTLYYLRVRARDAAGNYSGYSTYDSISTAAGAYDPVAALGSKLLIYLDAEQIAGVDGSTISTIPNTGTENDWSNVAGSVTLSIEGGKKAINIGAGGSIQGSSTTPALSAADSSIYLVLKTTDFDGTEYILLTHPFEGFKALISRPAGYYEWFHTGANVGTGSTSAYTIASIQNVDAISGTHILGRADWEGKIRVYICAVGLTSGEKSALETWLNTRD